MNPFSYGFKRILPIMTGVVPFGAVMGTVAAEAKLTLAQSVFMNIFVFAGASQLAAVDLMTKHTPLFVVAVTGLIINLRFLLYSAAISPILQKSNFLTKLSCAYFLTDQSYAVMSAHEDEFKNSTDTLLFYFGSCACMALTWHFSVLGGYLFGNFAPSTWALDYAVPLSFIALVIPALKNKKYIYVAIFSFMGSLIMHQLPYRLGLIVTALAAMLLAFFLTRKKKVENDL